MATTLETLVVKLAGDSVDYDKTLKSASGSLDSFAKNAKNIGDKLSLAVTTPLLAMGGVALNSASDLEETISKVDTLFGNQAASIQEWANTSSTAFGLSKQAALDSVGTIGNMFMQLGADSGQAAQAGQGMVQLAADIASFHNVAGGSTAVLDSLNAAFRGEYDSLQQYIPTINAAAVEQAALSATGKTAASELTALEKATAVQTLVMQGAGAAVGDFARTSDGLANSQRILQADLANVTADLGKELLPIALDVAKELSVLLGWFKDLSPETKKWIVVIAGVAAAAGPVIGTIGAIAGGISGLIGLVGGTAGITALLGGLGTALTVLTGPIGLIVLAVAGLATAWATDFLGIKTKTGEFWTWLTGAWPGWMGNLKTGWEGFAEWWTSDTDTKLATVKGGWEGFIGWIDTNTGGALTNVKGHWENFASGVQGVVDGHWGTIKQTTEAGIEASKGFVTAGLQFMQGDWSGGLETLRSTAEGLWGTIYSMFGTQIDSVMGVITAIDWANLGSAIVQGIADGISNSLSWIRDAAEDAAREALNAAKSWLGIGSPSKVAAKELGKPFSQGVGVGAMQEMPRVSDRIQSALDSMMGSFSMPEPATAGAGARSGSTIQITINLQGRATYEDGRNVGMGVSDELRARGLA